MGDAFSVPFILSWLITNKKCTGKERENCIIELTTANLSQGYAYSILLQQFYKQAIQTTFYCTQNLFSLASIFTQTRVHNPISPPSLNEGPPSIKPAETGNPTRVSVPPIPLISKNSKVITKINDVLFSLYNCLWLTWNQWRETV